MPKVNVDKLRSKFEAEVYRGLQSFKRQLRYDIDYETVKVPYVVEQTYLPDFVVSLNDGRKVFLEAKGYWTSVDRRKIRLVKEQNPNLDIRMVFQQDNKLHRNSNTRYSDYCERWGIPYTVGEIPKEWFE